MTLSLPPNPALAEEPQVLPVPPQGGLTVGLAGSSDPVAVATAQRFDVGSVTTYDVEAQRFRVYVPGAPPFASTLAAGQLTPDSAVFIRRASTERVDPAPESPGTPPGGAGLPVPPDGGLTVGTAGAETLSAFLEGLPFSAASVSFWSIEEQRFLVHVPGAPAHVSTLQDGHIQPGSIVFVRRGSEQVTPGPGTSPPPPADPTDLWVTGWYAGWYQNHLPPSAIDFSVVTHLIHFMITPRSDGTISYQQRPGFETPGQIAGVVNAAHEADRHVLVSVGGAGFYEPFRDAIGPGVRSTFVQSLRSFVAEHGYDGIDVDMEPIHPSDYENFQAFVTELRGALQADNPGALVTVAAGPSGAICPIQDQFDQINLMTYDMSGPWPGWVVWHNSPITSGGLHFPAPNDWRPLPSADERIQGFVEAGCDERRLAIGTSWYAYVWDGVTEPLQTWTTPPEIHVNLPYFWLHENYDLSQTQWDEAGQAAYLSLPAQNRFISFDNEQSVAAKVAYTRERGLGGIAIWELAGGYVPGAPVPDSLLQALGDAIRSEAP